MENLQSLRSQDETAMHQKNSLFALEAKHSNIQNEQGI